MEPTRSTPPRASSLRRYGPLGGILALVLIVVAVVAVTNGRDDGNDTNGASPSTGVGSVATTTGTSIVATDGASTTEVTTSTTAARTPHEELVLAGPMTPEKADLLGVDIDFGEGCDVNTGRVKIPSVYAPPCVEPFAGVNGGSTSPGVTADEIVVVAYRADPAFDTAAGGLTANAGVDTDPEAAFKTLQGFFELYQGHFELYGRTVRLVSFTGTGAGSDAVRAQADAIAIVEQHHPFAVIGAPSGTGAFADELAARKVLCVGSCAGAPTEEHLEELAPYLWPVGPSVEQFADLSAEMVATALKGRAEHAGDPAMRTQERVFGSLHYQVPGEPTTTFDRYEANLAERGIKLAVDVPFALDFARIQEIARTAITRLKDSGVTTVLLAGDPYSPLYFTQEATQQGYFPEWVIGPNLAIDLNLAARQYDQKQWANAFGITTLAVRATEAARRPFDLYQWQFGMEAPSNAVGAIGLDPGLLFTGLHLAGPDLTPQSFADGLFRAPASGGTILSPANSRGKNGAWPDRGDEYIDRFGTDDVAIIYWDPDAEGEDELGKVGRGLYRFADGGRRYRQGELPADPGVFNDATSVAILEALPPDVAPPDYPSPAGG